MLGYVEVELLRGVLLLFARRMEIDGRGVDAESFPGRFRAVVEHVAQMSAAL